jgi:hypothetical protein
MPSVIRIRWIEPLVFLPVGFQFFQDNAFFRDYPVVFDDLPIVFGQVIALRFRRLISLDSVMDYLNFGLDAGIFQL